MAEQIKGAGPGGSPAPFIIRRALDTEIKGVKMEYIQDNNPLQTSLLHEFMAVSIESAVFIMTVMVMIMVW